MDFPTIPSLNPNWINDYVLPSGEQLVGLAAACCVIVLLSTIGRAMLPRSEFREADLIIGWSVIIVLFKVLGTIFDVPFATIALIALGIAAIAVTKVISRGSSIVSSILCKVYLLACPLVLIVSALEPSQWDELSQWLPNAQILLEHGGFPRSEADFTRSAHAAYPFGLPIFIYLTSLMAGEFTANAGAVLNVILLINLGLLAVRVGRAAIGHSEGTVAGLPFVWGAAAILICTILNPTFVPKIVFTAYADSTTAVVLSFYAVFVWRMLNATDVLDPRASVYAWGAFFSGIVLVSLKQPNIVLMAAVCLASIVLACRDRRLLNRAFWRNFLTISIGPCLIFLIWKIYVFQYLDAGDLKLRELAAWNFDSIDLIVYKMGVVAAHKGGFFSIAIMACGASVFLLRRVSPDAGRLAVITATVFVIYNAFLLFIYVSAFSAEDAVHVISYWRFNTHLGGLALIFAVFWVFRLWKLFKLPSQLYGSVGLLALALVIIGPLAFAKKLRFDIQPGYQYARHMGQTLATILTRSDRLILVDQNDNGQYLMLMRYALYNSAVVVKKIDTHERPVGRNVTDTARNLNATHAWIRSGNTLMQNDFGKNIREDRSYLFVFRDGNWQVISSWPN